MIIVAFHRVSDQFREEDLTCSAARFEEFCRFFRNHFRVVPLSEQLAGRTGDRRTGGTLSITFDDGYRDNFEVAAPILRKLSLPATFFVTTAFISSRIVAPWDRELPRQPGWMDWDQLRLLAAEGFEIGCHTDTHIDMGAVDEERVRTELEVSSRKLREQLGRPTHLFAYPFGGSRNISERSLELVREAGFECCVSCAGGFNTQATSPFKLNRISVGPWFATPEQFGVDLLLGRL